MWGRAPPSDATIGLGQKFGAMRPVWMSAIPSVARVLYAGLNDREGSTRDFHPTSLCYRSTTI
jgi:hypothetical protein